MKNAIDQIYNEGLGSTLYIPIKKLIDKNIKGNANKIITVIFKIIYFVIILLVAFFLFYVTFPFI